MRTTKEVKQLAIHALKTLLAKVEKTSDRDENYAVLRNTQCSAEALMETFLNDGSTEDSYFSSDFGWKAGEWPLHHTLNTGEKITRTSANTFNAEGELTSVFYMGKNARHIEIFND